MTLRHRVLSVIQITLHKMTERAYLIVEMGSMRVKTLNVLNVWKDVQLVLLRTAHYPCHLFVRQPSAVLAVTRTT